MYQTPSLKTFAPPMHLFLPPCKQDLKALMEDSDEFKNEMAKIAASHIMNDKGQNLIHSFRPFFLSSTVKSLIAKTTSSSMDGTGYSSGSSGGGGMQSYDDSAVAALAGGVEDGIRVFKELSAYCEVKDELRKARRKHHAESSTSEKYLLECRINELTHILRLHRTVVNRMVAVLLCDDTKDTETTSVTPKYAEAPDPWGRETKTGSSLGPEGVAGRTKSARRGGDALQSI